MNLNPDQHLERVLESAVVVSWPELMRDAKSASIHIEYGFARDGALDHVQIWSSTRRGYWLLACSYWMSASKLHDRGIHFDNGYQSARLAQILEVVMQHQNLFSLPQDLGRQGLVHLTTPTEEERKTAAVAMSDVFRSPRFDVAAILLAVC